MSEDHFDRLLRLLEIEARAEADRRRKRMAKMSPGEAERLGETLIDLAVDDENLGLGGRWLWTLCKRNRTLRLPWTRIGVGTPVLLTSTESESTTLRGVVSGRNERTLTVALPGPPDDVDSGITWRVDLAADEKARERQRAALRTLRGAAHGRTAQWRELLAGTREPKFHDQPPIAPLDAGLNEAQREAVRLALSADDLAIIHGPPGTGKTTTLVELIRQAVGRREKVLVTAAGNLGVDNLLQRLTACGVRTVRLGHPARVLPELRRHTLDYLVEDHPDVKVAERLRREASKLFRQAGRWTRSKPQPGERGATRAEARQLLDDARRIERQVEEHLLDSAEVVCATLTGLDDSILGDRQFEWAVVDEAAQATEPPCWIPLVRCRRLVLGGDHCQLPPTIISREAADGGLAVSLMERLMQTDAERRSRLLAVQYRMHADIMDFSSHEFYDDRLQVADEVCSRVLADLPGIADVDATRSPLQLIDTAGAGYDETEEPDGESRFNEQEALLVCRKVRELRDAGLPGEAIAVITPYAAQARRIRELLGDAEVEVDSVDGFQGREKEAVVVSLVRSNTAGEIGFLADVRRMNVALTRARRKLIVVGDGAVLGGHPFYRNLLEYFERRGAYRSVWEEPPAAE